MKQAVLIVLVLVGLGIAGWLTYRSGTPSTSSQDFPEGTLWVCTNESCAADFRRTVSELADHYREHPGQDPTCPVCDSAAVRGIECVHCGHVYPRPGAQPGPPVCPACGEEAPKLIGDDG